MLSLGFPEGPLCLHHLRSGKPVRIAKSEDGVEMLWLVKSGVGQHPCEDFHPLGVPATPGKALQVALSRGVV